MALVTLDQNGVETDRGAALPALFAPNHHAAERFFGFFTVHIRNPNTRRAYTRIALRFADWAASHGLVSLTEVRPIHVAAYIEGLSLAKPSVKQHLAALRMLFDWLVLGHVITTTNPAHPVRGPKHIVTKGRTSVLEHDEARILLASIEPSTLINLRDRALISLMLYTFARIGAVLQMNAADYFVQGRRRWVRLHEKGGKEHTAPCVAMLEETLDAYLVAAGITDDSEGPLFRTSGRRTGISQRMTQPDAFRMIGRRAKRAGIATRIGNHSLRATGITTYLKHDGTLEHAQMMAAHSSPRTTKLYDRRGDEVTVDEYDKIRI
jgi:site-specific recombinase XerD